jgi:hypothetical protein
VPRSFPNQVGPVHGVVRGGALGTAVGQLLIVGLGDGKADVESIFFCGTRGPGAVGCQSKSGQLQKVGKVGWRYICNCRGRGRGYAERIVCLASNW